MMSIGPKAPEILSSKIVAESRLFQIEEQHLRFSNGEERHYERVLGRAIGSVMLVPMLNNNTVLLIREYGAGIEAYTLGFPKGAIDRGESLLVSAGRELQEEVGYQAGTLTELGKMSASPGYLSATMTLFVATDLTPSRLPGDEPEPLQVVEWSLDDISALLAHPEFHEARSIAALLWVERLRHAR